MSDDETHDALMSAKAALDWMELTNNPDAAGPCAGLIKPGSIMLTREMLRDALPCRCREGYKIRNMIDPDCVIHYLELELFGPAAGDEK